MTQGFIETPLFPNEIAYWASGGGNWKTTVVETYGGNEYRTQAWSQQRGKWTVADAFRSQNPSSALLYKSLVAFYNACRGSLYAFRFKDFRDYQDDGNGVLGLTGLAVAATTAYQMYKNYSVSPNLYQRMIVKPTVGATKVYNNGVLQILGVDYNIDESTGIVTFTSQPTVGHTLTWTGTFEVPARFDSDAPDMGPTSEGALLDWQSLAIVEVRNWN